MTGTERRRKISFRAFLRRRLELQNWPEPEELKPTKRRGLRWLGCRFDRHYRTIEQVGSGRDGDVYECVQRRSKLSYAVKRIVKSNVKAHRLESEIAILRSASEHPNIVSLVDVFETPREVQLVQDLAAGGDLWHSLAFFGAYPEADAVRHFREVASAVKYLHSKGIVHRDIKPENLLLTSENPLSARLMLADFGMSRMEDTRGRMTTRCGTWHYMAPEVRRGKRGYTRACDMWSLGIVFYLLLSATHPFDVSGKGSEEETWRNARKGRFGFEEVDPAWQGVGEGTKALIRHLIVVNPMVRLTASEAHFAAGELESWLPGGDSATAAVAKATAAEAAVFEPRAPGSGGEPQSTPSPTSPTSVWV